MKDTEQSLTTSQYEEKKSFVTSNWFVALSIISACVFVIFVSVFILSKQSLRLDEAQSLWQTSHSLNAMYTIIAHEAHIPFYHTILHFWQIVFGNDVYYARILSLIFFVISIPCLYALANRAFGRKVALFSVLLFSLSPFMNWYGNEIRMYSLLTLFTILTQYFYIGILKHNNKRNWFGYALSVFFGIFTHYFFLINLLIQGMFFLVNRKEFGKHAFKKFFVIAVIAAGLIAPWIMLVLKQGAASNTLPLLSKPSTVDLFDTYSQFLFGFESTSINTLIVSLWPIVVLLIFLFMRRHKNITIFSMYFFIAAIIPTALVFLLSVFFRPFYLSRYLIIALPALYIFIAWFLDTYPRKLALILKTLLIVGVTLSFVRQMVIFSVPIEEDYKGATTYINQNATFRDVVVVSAPFTLYPIQYYYQSQAALTSLPVWDQSAAGAIPTFSKETLPKTVQDIAGTHEYLWLMLSYDQGYEKDIKDYFENHYKRTYSNTFSPGLNVYKYQLKY